MQQRSALPVPAAETEAALLSVLLSADSARAGATELPTADQTHRMASLALENEQFRTPAPGSQHARILVVDDESTIRLVLAKYLRTRGFEVATAESGDAALEALADSKFDLMLCAVRMPGLSGVEIVPSALEADPDLGIVMLSAVNDASTATEAMSQGVLDYLTKPVELGGLHGAVTRALQKRAQLREQVAAQTRDLELQRTQLREVAVATLEMLVATMEAKDALRRGRSARIGELAASVADYMGLAP